MNPVAFLIVHTNKQLLKWVENHPKMMMKEFWMLVISLLNDSNKWFTPHIIQKVIPTHILVLVRNLNVLNISFWVLNYTYSVITHEKTRQNMQRIVLTPQVPTHAHINPFLWSSPRNWYTWSSTDYTITLVLCAFQKYNKTSTQRICYT